MCRVCVWLCLCLCASVSAAVSVSVGVHTHALIQPARQRQEVLNRRLFSTVREKKRLTYDANFHLTGFERIHGGWYISFNHTLRTSIHALNLTLILNSNPKP